MEITTFPVPSLHGGISEQPEKIRKVFQCGDTLNTLPTLDNGFRLKRPPSKYLGKISITTVLFADLFKTSTDEYFWFIVTTGGAALVYKLDGTPVTTITDATALAYLASGISTYDTTKLYKLMPVLDYTFILNKSVVTAVTEEATPLYPTYGTGFVYVPQAISSIAYNITVDIMNSAGASIDTIGISLNTGASATTTGIISAISALITLPHLTVLEIGSLLSIKARRSTVEHGGNAYYAKIDHTAGATTKPGVGVSWATAWTLMGTSSGVYPAWASGVVYYSDATAQTFDIRVTTSDGYGNQLFKSYSSSQYILNGVTRHVVSTDTYQDLPPNGPYDGTIVFKVTDHYFVKYDTNKSAYVECAAPGYNAVINKTTMPIKMVYDPVTPKFTLSAIQDFDTTGRLVGDSVSAPNPSFIGNAMSDIGFFRNRFFITASDSFNMSRSKGYYFSFYPQTATEVLDDDPIFGIPDSNDLNILGYAIPVKNNMMVTAPKRSFFIHSGTDPMTPNTATGDPVTDFTIRGVPPVTLGSSIMFLEDRGAYTGVLDFVATKESVASEASKITAHVPELLPSTVSKMIPVTSSDMLMVLTNATNDIYVYKYYVDESNQLQQSAWTKWELRGTIVAAGVTSGTVVAFLCRDPLHSGLFIESIDTGYSNPDATNRFTYCLDRGTNLTIMGSNITVPASAGSAFDFSAVTIVDKTTGKLVDFNGISDGTYFMGYPYESYIELTPPYPKDENGTPRYDIETNIRDLRVDYFGGIFQLEVTPINRTKRTYESLQYMQQGLSLDLVDLVHSNANFNPTKFLIYSRNEGCTIKIKSSYHTPLDIYGLAYKLALTQLENN